MEKWVFSKKLIFDVCTHQQLLSFGAEVSCIILEVGVLAIPSLSHFPKLHEFWMPLRGLRSFPCLLATTSLLLFLFLVSRRDHPSNLRRIHPSSANLRSIGKVLGSLFLPKQAVSKGAKNHIVVTRSCAHQRAS